MMKRLIYLGLLCISILNAAIVDTNKEVYVSNEEIIASFSELEAEASEWMAVYPAESNNDFGNIIQWKLTDANMEGEVTFNGLNVGTYEIRLFNSANFVIAKQFSVDDNPAIVTTVETTQDTYLPGEQIVAVFDNMSGNEDDWIGIYPAGSTNDWANMLQWEWVEDGLVSGTHTFDVMPAGDYEVRAFFNNSFNTEASYAFNIATAVLNIEVRKDIYDPYELLHVDFENIRGVNTDWIGIFPVGAGNDKNSAVEWRDTKGLVNGELSFNGIITGAYEARVYFDTLLQKTVNFTVRELVANRIIYDDFEDGIIDPRWVRAAGKDMTILNVGAIDGTVAHTERQLLTSGQHSLRTYRDYRGGVNYAGYYFDFENPDSTLRFLEVDMKIGESSHVFAFGVKLKTKLGDRRIEFASWLNHTLPSGQQIIRGPYGNVLEGHRQAFTQDNYLYVHPSPSDYYVGTSSIGAGTNMFVHYKINIEEKLRLMEPDNELLGVTLFTTSGGDYDNLSLTTH